MEKNKQKKAIRCKRVMMSLMTFVLLLWSSGFYSLADANYGKAAGSWVLEQLFWIGIVCLAVGLVGCIMKRAWIAAIILVIGGGILLAFMKDPNLISTIGKNIVNTVFNG